ncbi:hypothetical protein ARMSODRAFT_1080706 [Armillaria solidipes]|uniref:Uncharacterized protein n=1 Tax=Armillaria solidipes TaxID=1076256 RepID=A0A2H3CID2_9AGAR|nr:hypothetical protein ARMSODRAFT_1080706 [Armillaria solidipes]
MSSKKKHSNRKQPTRPSHPPDNSSKSHTPAGKDMRVVGVLVDDTSSVFMNANTNTRLKDIIEQTEERLTMTLQNSFHFEKTPKIIFCQIGPAISTSRETDVGNNLLYRVADISLPVPTAYATFTPAVNAAIANKLKKDRADATMYRLQESTQTGGADMQEMLLKFEALQKSVQQQISACAAEGRKEVAAAVAYGERRVAEEVAAARVELKEVKDELASNSVFGRNADYPRLSKKYN